MQQPPNTQSASTSQDAMIVFCLGLAGVTIFHIVAPVAWVLGNRYVQKCAQEGVAPDQLAVVGRILGMIGTALMVFGLVIFVAILVWGVAIFGLMLRH